MSEARLEESGAGKMPVSDGWFVVNARDTLWLTSDSTGSVSPLEGKDVWFPQVGMRIRVLEPGHPNARYHSEAQQEAFLVLSGECRLIVEEEERLLGPWDFFHCPAGTPHVFVGAGDGPCAILMVGARTDDEQLLYPVSELAALYGASVAEETSDPEQAYAEWEEHRLGRPASWDRLPWVTAPPTA